MAKQFVVTEENFHFAVNKASFWARRRLWKKMDKSVFRVVDFIKGSEGRPTKDLELWVENFVQMQVEKHGEKS